MATVDPKTGQPIFGGYKAGLHKAQHMNSLDLHNTLHKDVENVLLGFINWEEPPYKIITGKSSKMQDIVKSILKNNNLYWINERFDNFGCLVVLESTFTKGNN